MSKLTFLEDFDVHTAPAQIEAVSVQQPSYEQGCDDGRKQVLAEQDHLKSDLIEKITDLSFVYAEARAEIINGLKPLFDALADKVLPELASQIHQTKITEFLLSEATGSMDRPITLRVPNGDAGALMNALPEEMIAKVQVLADPSLFDGEVAIGTSSDCVNFDTGKLVQDVSEVLRAIHIPTEDLAQNE